MSRSYQNISHSLSFLQETISLRLQHYFQKENSVGLTYPVIKLERYDSPFNKFFEVHNANVEEFIILLLALAPHLQPNFIDTLVQQYLSSGGDFPEIGGVKGTNHRGTIPTGETALFILAGTDIGKRMEVAKYFSPDHFFGKEHILYLEPVKEGEPQMSGKIILQQEYVDLFTTGKIPKPSFGPDFPAKMITTQQNWKDVVLPDATRSHLQELYAWLQYNQVAMNDPVLKRKTKPGYRALFYGPSGTGKTLVATLLGQEFQKDVYRIDLSQVVSKYIGETEKNLERIFSRAEHQDWILFFDEADALFGKRSNVQSAHDKYANQEVSYLLQRVEDFPGMVILASNFKSNIDQAFLRRFNSIIEFPQPGAAERLQLWQKAMPETFATAKEVNLKWLADKYELTGSSINQVVHQAVLQMHLQKENMITNDLLQQAISRELRKSDKLLQ